MSLTITWFPELCVYITLTKIKRIIMQHIKNLWTVQYSRKLWARNENLKTILITYTVILGKSYNSESLLSYLFVMGLWLFLRVLPAASFRFQNSKVFFWERQTKRNAPLCVSGTPVTLPFTLLGPPCHCPDGANMALGWDPLVPVRLVSAWPPPAACAFLEFLGSFHWWWERGLTVAVRAAALCWHPHLDQKDETFASDHRKTLNRLKTG